MVEAVQARTTPLHDLHVELGGRLVPFAGWELPIQYEGVIAEHAWCRSSAALFDVSHMGVVELRLPGESGEQAVAALADRLETLTPASVATIGEGRQRYSLLTNDDGGIIDDFIITNRGDHLMVVVNASRRDVDLARLRSGMPDVDVIERTDMALIALQGPKAVDALARLAPGVTDMIFLDFRSYQLDLGGAVEVGISRSGYTGEDGFELLVPGDRADELARALLAMDEVLPAGLGARDTLRLEAGLALYGNDLDETTSPVEADLVWTMPKRRREDARFAGSTKILADYETGTTRRRVGLRPEGRRPVRDGRRCGPRAAIRPAS